MTRNVAVTCVLRVCLVTLNGFSVVAPLSNSLTLAGAAERELDPSRVCFQGVYKDVLTSYRAN